MVKLQLNKEEVLEICRGNKFLEFFNKFCNKHLEFEDKIFEKSLILTQEKSYMQKAPTATVENFPVTLSYLN